MDNMTILGKEPNVNFHREIYTNDGDGIFKRNCLQSSNQNLTQATRTFCLVKRVYIVHYNLRDPV